MWTKKWISHSAGITDEKIPTHPVQQTCEFVEQYKTLRTSISIRTQSLALKTPHFPQVVYLYVGKTYYVGKILHG